MKVRERRISKAWRNAGFAFAAVGVLVLGTQGVLSAISTGAVSANSEAALEDCGRGEVASVSEDGYACED